MNFPADLRDPSYNQMVLAAVTGGAARPQWAKVTSSAGGHTATFDVFADALSVDGVRLNVSAELEQQIADALGCLLLTPKLADLHYAQRAVTVMPSAMPIASTSAAMIDESARMDEEIASAGGVPEGGIVGTVGKHWVCGKLLLEHPGMAINYGWMVPKGTSSPWGGIPVYPSVTLLAEVIQQPSWAHNVKHLDYSQQCTLVHRDCVVDGQGMDLADVLQSAELAALASHEGPLPPDALRQPGVAQFACPLPGGTAGTSGTAGLCPRPPPHPSTTSGFPWRGVLVVGSLLLGGAAAVGYLSRA